MNKTKGNTMNPIRSSQTDEYIRHRTTAWYGTTPDYTFTETPTLRHRYIQKLATIQQINDAGFMPRWRDVLRVTDPEKLTMKNWGCTTRQFLSGCGYTTETKGRIEITLLGRRLLREAAKNSVL